MEFGQTGTFARLCFSAQCVFILAVFASRRRYEDCTVDPAPKA